MHLDITWLYDSMLVLVVCTTHKSIRLVFGIYCICPNFYYCLYTYLVLTHYNTVKSTSVHVIIPISYIYGFYASIGLFSTIAV